MNRDGEVTSGDAQRALLKSAGGLDEAEVTVSNLSAPGSVTADNEISLSADLENLGNEGALQNITVRAALEGEPLDENATLDEQFVDMAVAGVSTPVDRAAQTTITFENVTVDLDPGNYTLGVFSENDNVTAPLTVEANSEVTGTVTASGDTASAAQTPGAGDPVEGVDVTLYEGDSTNATDELETTTTNANGSYEFDQLAPDDYTVEVEATNFSADSALVSVGADETVQQDFALDYAEAGAISGDISLDTVDPGEDVPVTVEVVETGDNTTVTLTGDNDTASYTIDGVDVNVDDGYTVTASETTGNYDAPANAMNVTVDVGATTTGVDFTFDRQTGGANGTVVASGDTASTTQTPGDGEGIENATIEVYAFQGDDSGSPTFTFENATGPNGAFDLPTDTFPVGEHFVVVSATNLSSAGLPVTITEGENDLGEIPLDYAEAGAVSGQVSLDTVDPGEDVSVTVEVVETGDSTTVTLAGGTDVASYTIDGVDVNVDSGYTVTASETTGNYDAPANATNVTVDVGATTTGVDFTFTRQTGGANGTVVASGETASTTQTPGAGEGVENATIDVYAFQDDDSGTPKFTFENATDATGAFDLSTDTLPVGEHFVVVDATNFSSAGLNVTITEGENDLGEVALDYAEPGAVSGTVSLDMFDPSETVNVTVTVAETGDNTTVTLAGSSNTTTYTIPDVDVNVDAGYTVSASSDSTNYTDPADVTNVTVDVGETVTQDFTFTRQTGGANGTVVASGETVSTQQTPGTGEGVENATIEVYTFQSDANGTATFTFENATDASGVFDLPTDTFPVGEHFVVVSATNFSSVGQVVTIDEGSNDLGEIPLDYAQTGAISGQVSLNTVDPSETVNITVEIVETGNSTTVTLAGSANTTNYTIPDVDVNVDSGYTVTASEDTGNYDAPANATNVTVDVGATTTGVDFTFDRQTGGANGTVVASGETASTTQTPGAEEGIENATIEVYAFQSDDSGTATFTFENATSPNGEFDLADTTFPVGEHFVVVSATNFSSVGLPVTITEGSNDLGEIALNYSEAGEITGTVTLDTVDPGETVNVTIEVVETGDSTTVTLAGETNATSYIIPGVDVNVDSGYSVSASSDSTNYTDPADVTNVTVDVGETVTQDFGFTRQTGGANGTVVASGETASTTQTPGTGEGVENATIEVYTFQSNDNGTATFTFENATDASGAFDLPTDTFPVGEHFVVVDATNLSSASLPVTITEGENDLGEIALDYASAGAVSGEIALDSSDPGETVNVTVTVAETGDTTTVTLAGTENSTTYTVPDVDVNVDSGYTVTASSDSANYDDPTDATNVTVDVGATTTGVDFTFTRQTGALNGTVVENGTESPIEGATVEVSAFGSGGPVVAATTTDANGEYSIGSLPVGEHAVTVSVNGSVAGERSASINANQTTTVDFAFDTATFTVDIGGALAGAAGETQTADITVANTGELPGEQTITLDWGGGAYTNSTTPSLAGGASTTVALSVTTDATQALGVYTVTATSADDSDAVNATLGPGRTLNQTVVEPGGTVNVTVTGQVGASGDVSFADAWSPPANGSEIISTSFTRGLGGGSPNDVILASDGAVSTGPLEIVYEIAVPASADGGTVYEWEPAQDGDGSFLQVGNENFPIFGDQSFEIELVSPVDDVLLDSVSSLLNASGQPLIDDSITAIEAEPSATNEDTDGDGDAVSYPSDVDIPVLAVDDNVVGVTGPFVTTDTDFANFGNEEVMLNLYDELLGGSGTIVHDEGHGQFYTLAPNGGDDFRAFAGYAEDNGYTYTNTTDIQNATGTADAFVITSPSEAFTQSELDALSTFVDNGGVVFLHDQSDFNNFDATDNHNAIASAVNASFRFNDDQVVDDQNNTGARFVPTTGNFDTDRFTPLFSDREGLGLELDINESYEVDVISVTDGDTVDVQFNNSEGTIDTVRVNGIDTAETGTTDERLEEYEGIDNGTALRDRAEAAVTYAQNQLANETVTLSFAPTEGLRGDFGRLLGFLELQDGSVYNEEVIRDGWARVYDSGFSQHDEYWELEQQARANGSGIWDISDPANTSEIRDDPVTELFFPRPVAVTGPETPVSSENGEPLVALDRDANVAALGGPLVEERYETAEGGAGIDQYEVFPFVTNVMEAVGNATGPVVVDAGHDQFASDYAVSAEDTAYYMRYLEGQSPGNESFIGLDGTVDLASEPGPDLVDNGSAAARAVIISTPNSELTPAERTAVADFADAGGAVILMGTSANTTALSNFDSLLNELNTTVGFTGTNVTDATNNLAGNSLIPTTSNFSSGSPELFTAFTPPANLSVSSLSPQTAIVNETESFDVSATVENTGGSFASEAIELRLEPDGSTVETQQVQLAAGANTTVTFENVSVSQGGQYNHTVASATDEVIGSLTVEFVIDELEFFSTSSVLNETGGALTDSSRVAVWAEPTAYTNSPEYRDEGDPEGTGPDIPLVGVDGSVVAIGSELGPDASSEDENRQFIVNTWRNTIGSTGTVLFDETHGQEFSIDDDFSQLDSVATDFGFEFDNITQNFESRLDDADGVMIASSDDDLTQFTQSELDALSTFVADGGALFLHDTADFGGDSTDVLNEILNETGTDLRFNVDQVEDDQNSGFASFVPRTSNFNEAEFPALFNGGSTAQVARTQITNDASEDDSVNSRETVVSKNIVTATST